MPKQIHKTPKITSYKLAAIETSKVRLGYV